MFKLIFNIQ